MSRRSRAELLAEFHRLSDIFETFVDFEIKHADPQTAELYKTSLQPRDHWLALVERKEATLSQLIAGVREAINDQNEKLSDWIEGDPPFANMFFRFYRERNGRDYYDDAGNPRKMARAILRRGHIADETEFRFLNGILSNLDQTVFKDKDIARVTAMLATFEASV